MKLNNLLFQFIIILIAISFTAFAQPASTASFGNRLDAMAGMQSVIDGEGNAIDIFDISDGENPAASHHNEADGVPVEWLDKIGGADRYAMDVSFKTLEYPGPNDNNGEKRSWYWVDGVARMMVEKGFSSNFSMRIKFNGGYQTLRKSWQDGWAPWPNEVRHNYSAATLDWDDLHVRGMTAGAASVEPIGEFYGTYHFPFGLSIGAGGGYAFSEFEDLSYYGGWQTTMKGNVTAYRAKFGARYTYPDYSDYFALGLSYGISGGKVDNEKDDDYTAYEDDDSRLGLQAEFGYPEYFSGAIGYESRSLAEDFYTDATDTVADESTDDVSLLKFKAHFLGDGINIPITIGFDIDNWSTDGESESNKVKITENITAFGIASEPVKDMLTFGAQYEMGKRLYEEFDPANESQLDFNRISFGTEVYPVREFGVRLGFEIFEYTTDFYSYIIPYVGSINRGYIIPSLGSIDRLHFVPDIEKGNALTGGFVIRLDEDRLLIELSARHYFADEPEIYKDNGPNRDEGFVGLTYYLK